MESEYSFYLLDGKYGIKQGEKVITPAVYEDANQNLTPHTKVWQDGCAGFVDGQGKVLLPCTYADAFYLFEDCYAVRKDIDPENWAFGIVDTSGKERVGFDYKYIGKNGSFICCYKEAKRDKYTPSVSGEKYYYSKSDECVVLNKSFECIFKGEIWECQGEYLLVSEGKGNFLNMIDITGKKLFSNGFDFIKFVKDDLFVVRKPVGDNWRFGVIRKDESILIDFVYQYIESYGNFFRCCEQAECYQNNHAGLNHRLSFGDFSESIWLNKEGKIIYKGHGIVIFEDALGVCKDKKWGIINESGARIANFLYDKVCKVADKIAVYRDNKVGILNANGTIFLDAVYDSIESVNIGQDDKLDDGWPPCRVPGKYSHEKAFDTANTKQSIARCYLPVDGSQSFLSVFDFNQPLILSKNGSCELYKEDVGFVKYSKYDAIEPLTNLSFCVRKDGKYGVFRIDGAKLIIPCEFDQIQFEGEHTVLLRKGDLWGAKDLFIESQKGNKLVWGVNIEPQFFSINIMNREETLFSVEKEYTSYKGEVKRGYTIYNRYGKELDAFSSGYVTYTDHFIVYNQDRLLTRVKDKFGFVNISNQNTIPFIYDEILLREDKNFDVRIGNAWGVLNISGREILPVKFNSKISFKDELLVVVDSRSGKRGVLRRDFVEVAPCLFEHLFIPNNSDFIYFGYGGYESSERNFFVEDVEGAKWGCMTKRGRIIVPAKYDCFKEECVHILAGRDGGFLQRGQNSYCPEYSGVYDMFDLDGKLIFGGFDRYIFDEDRKWWFFQLGGSWKQECEEYDEVGNAIFYFDYKYIDKGSKWIILDEEMKSVIPRTDGTIDSLGVGFIHKIRKEVKDGQTTLYWSLPSFEMTSETKPHFEYGALICKYKDYLFAVIRDKKFRSVAYKRMSFYAPDKFFYCTGEEEDVRISKIVEKDGDIYENDSYLTTKESADILTIPQNGYFFRVSRVDDNNLKVVLMKEYEDGTEDVAAAISSGNRWQLSELIAEGLLKIDFDGDGSSLKDIILPRHDVFDSSFIEMISQKEGRLVDAKRCKTYWFENGEYDLSSYRNQEDYDDSGNYGYDDYNDYDPLYDAFEGDVELYNDWLLN